MRIRIRTLVDLWREQLVLGAAMGKTTGLLQCHGRSLVVETSAVSRDLPAGSSHGAPIGSRQDRSASTGTNVTTVAPRSHRCRARESICLRADCDATRWLFLTASAIAPMCNVPLGHATWILSRESGARACAQDPPATAIKAKATVHCAFMFLLLLRRNDKPVLRMFARPITLRDRFCKTVTGSLARIESCHPRLRSAFQFRSR